MTGFDWAYEHRSLTRAIELLQVTRLASTSVHSELSPILARASWLATLLANSDSHAHRKRSLLFAALLKQVNQGSPEVEAICFTIFARTGTIPAVMHLDKVVASDDHYIGPSLGPLSHEFAAAYNIAFSPTANRLLTEFQRRTSVGLRKSEAGVISAPTSAGKSFIIHEYVKARLRAGTFRALFIVPTKALITQVAATYRKFAVQEHRNLTILSSIPDGMQPTQGSEVFALTQERCIRLVSSQLVGSLDFVFADEIQSLEDTDRGALLEYVLSEIRRRAPKAQMFAAGPFIENSQALGTRLFKRECPPLETEDSPVSQMIIEVTPIKGKSSLMLRVVGADVKSDTSIPFNVTRNCYSRWRGSPTHAISDVVGLFRGESPAIVYARGRGTAEKWAKEFAASKDESPALGTEARELIDFVAESIHPQCSLIECLKRRIAYHHSGLPDFVREEVEGLFSEKQIDVLFCTSTLLEGVNLPAEKIFVLSAMKADDQLTPFEFRNLIGRAGRLDQHLCGLIYCIQIPGEEQPHWLDSFRDESRKTVTPYVDTRLAAHFDAINSLLESGQPVTQEGFAANLRSTATFLRSRFLGGREQIVDYLKNRGLSPEKEATLLSSIERSVAAISIPAAVALKNPYVDPILQNVLFEEVRKAPNDWNIRRARGFSTDFEDVFKRLDAIFGILAEIAPIGNPMYYRNDLLTFAKLWLRGKPFNEIVNRALPPNVRHSTDVLPKAVDKAIKRAMDFITRDVSFITAKYFTVLAEILRACLDEDQLGEFQTTLAVPVMLELGCSERRTLALVTACVPRAAAIRIANLIPVDEEDPVGWLTSHQSAITLQRLPLIYKKILQRIGIWT